ncbi:hypothetical protein BMI91_05690 [Thioclava sediminum]|uniref:Glycosyl transferase family 1 domain-containing protein n=2 Tax=Thioclava sediminum TaxID=1915319 RepID=A0ABX3N301_9RHOB|nr:hypothetical protein BMI91_05690 [Thioclava sediminum]
MQAAARWLDLHGIEVVARDATYAWDTAEAGEGYVMHRIESAPLTDLLDRIAPEVVAVPGWSAPYALDALGWARARGARAVMMSDSNPHDARRRPFKEWLKRGIVSQAQAGFAAGSHARAYLERLGLGPAGITTGYDVVDNAHFARPRGTGPGRGFLAVARFVEKKNLCMLLDAYAAYRAEAGSGAWPLTLVGDGDMRPTLEAQIDALGLTDAVTLPGFVQYPDLPVLYHGAGALVVPSRVEQWGLVVNEAMAAGLPVLVSDMAGCALDLVVDGRTGFTFAPTDTAALTARMTELAADPARAAAMGEAAATHVADWGLNAFAEGLVTAVQSSLAAPPAPSGPALRLWALSQRRRR